MADIPAKRRGFAGLWCGNFAFLLMMLGAAVVVDGNGRLPGLNEALSIVILSCIVAGGLSLDVVLAILDGRRRGIAIAVALVYLLMLLPLFA
ncbi:unnamed protein product [marine sediment metagenome]|uniref:Major facilitator superfamily (MFS) profile domain-containing protein n=1 Tax=marine sediment metagenome TaxID=412755 RepID=X0SHE3_9ZZZZ